MDIPRPELARKKRIRRSLYAVGVLTLIPMVTLGLSRLKPAAPTVERATVWTDTNKALERAVVSLLKDDTELFKQFFRQTLCSRAVSRR